MTDNIDDKNSYIVLYYTPAFFAGFEEPPVKDPASPPCLKPLIKIWTRHPANTDINYCPSRRSCPIDLNNTPSNPNLDRSADIVDDHVNSESSGFTTLGPSFPHAYGAAGVYLSKNLLKDQLRSECGRPNLKRPPDQTAIVNRISSESIIRYHGFVGMQFYPVPDPTQGKPVKSEPAPPDASLWVVYHPGSASCESSRAPRKLLVPASSMLSDPAATPLPDNIDVSSAIYLEQRYALGEARLDVPKKPSGCAESEGSDLQVRSISLSPPRSKLSVFGFFPPAASPRGDAKPRDDSKPQRLGGEIARIRNRVTDGLTLSLLEGETLVDALTRYIRGKTPSDLKAIKTLDLIGHSRSRDDILKLGELKLTSRVAYEQFLQLYERGTLERFGLEKIRLLGCRTACSPRGRRVVAAIKDYFPDITVYAARADLFAVHYDANGFRDDATDLLADDEVIGYAGPGDNPPVDDYPPDPPNDDDDDDGDDSNSTPKPAPTQADAVFGVPALSDANAAAVAAKSFLYWDGFEEYFDEFVKMLHSTRPYRDNALVQADCEVLVAISPDRKTIDDFRSFDVFWSGVPRVRVHAADGVAYAFPFRLTDSTRVKTQLGQLGISAEKAHDIQLLQPGYICWV